MGKDHFLCYHNYLSAIKDLSDSERGRLFTALLTYSSTGEEPRLRGNEKFAFSIMAANIDRDKQDHEEQLRKTRERVARHRAKEKENNVTRTTRYTRYKSERDTEKENEKESTKEKDKEKETEKEKSTDTFLAKSVVGFVPNTDPATEKQPDDEDLSALYFRPIIDHLNKTAGKHFRWQTASTQKHIRARLREGRKLQDFLTVIDNMCTEWKGDPKMKRYIRPETLFGDKFEGYLNANLSPAPQEAPKPPGNFDTDDFFQAALKRTYGEE